MHIPDGFLDLRLALITTLVAFLYAVLSFRHLIQRASTREIVFISDVSASIFVAQLINFPLPLGVGIHFVGGGLAGVVLGPKLGFVSLFLVLLVQALLFHDGGLTTFGANLLNMAVIAVYSGFLLFNLVWRRGQSVRNAFIGGLVAGWISITLAGFAAGLELGLSTNFIYGLWFSVSLMTFYHFLLGFIEGFITGFVLAYLFDRGYSFPVVGDSHGSKQE